MGCGCMARKSGFSGVPTKFHIGRFCCVERYGSGVNSGKCGIIVNKALVRTDGRGVPMEIEGAYKPLRGDEVVLRLADGRLIAMFKDRLTCTEPFRAAELKSRMGLHGLRRR
jgi:hypothetical protein